MTVKQSLSFARRLTALVLAAVMLCVAVPAVFAEDAAPGATTIGGANTTLVPGEEENCLSWLFGSKDKITLPYLNIKGKGLRRNVTLDLVDCLVGITYTELGSIGSYVSASAAQEAWKAQAVAIHSYLEYHKQYGSSANALIYTPVEDIPSSARSAIRKAVESVKDEVLTYNGSVIDAVWSASAGYNTQTGVYGTCSSLDAWGSDVPYLKSVESPYERQYHEKLRRIIGKDYDYVEYNDSRTGEPYQSADTTHKDLGGFVQYNTLVSNGRSYRYINQFVSSRYCFDFSADAAGVPCMNYYGFGHGVGMSQCGAVGYAAEEDGLPRHPEALLLRRFHPDGGQRQLFRRRTVQLAAPPAGHVKTKGIAQNTSQMRRDLVYCTRLYSRNRLFSRFTPKAGTIR